MKHSKTITITVLAFLFTALNSYGSLKVLMKMDGASIPKGSSTISTISGFDDGTWIEILAASSAVSTATNIASSGGGAGKPEFSDLSIVKYADEISPTLTYYAASGKHLTKVFIVWINLGATEAAKMMEFELEDAIVTSVAMSGSEGDDRGSESATFNWAKMTMRSFDGQSAKSSALSETVFDRVKNTYIQNK